MIGDGRKSIKTMFTKVSDRRNNKFTNGSPCRKCGGTLRYVVRPNKCVMCTRKSGLKSMFDTTPDAAKTAMRRAIEDRQSAKEEI
jgi:hypothetical protein